MADEKCAFCNGPKRLYNQLRQRLLSWSTHVLSWVEAPGFSVCVLRYEDMKHDPVDVFERAVRFSGLEYGRKDILNAVEASSFEKLQRQEKEEGFKEKSPSSEMFFRKGEVGSWREELTEKQAGRVIQNHREIMERFGYIGANDSPTFFPNGCWCKLHREKPRLAAVGSVEK